MALRPLSDELLQTAQKEINEVPSRIEDDLTHIRDWLSKQPHLKARTDDQWLVTFLRCSKFRLEVTKEKLDIYYSMRYFDPEIFANRDPLSADIQEFLRLGAGVILPQKVHKGGATVALMRMKGTDPEKLKLESFMKFSAMLLDMILLTDDNYAVCGGHSIIDLEGVNYNYMKQATPYLINKLINVLQSSYPVKVEGIHILNFPSFGEVMFNTFKMLLPKKLSNRIHVYSKDKMADLYKIIPASILPEEYGGNEPSMDKLGVNTRELLESHRDWFLEDAQYFSDETKRIGKPRIDTQVFGTDGAFRKLELD